MASMVQAELKFSRREYAQRIAKTGAAIRDAEKVVLEGQHAGRGAAKPGNLCEDIARDFFAVLDKNGIVKDSRSGYPLRAAYPPAWGEQTMSLRSGDRTALEPDMTCHFMTCHFMTGLWMDDWGYETTESIIIIESGAECLADPPRRIIVKT